MMMMAPKCESDAVHGSGDQKSMNKESSNVLQGGNFGREEEEGTREEAGQVGGCTGIAASFIFVRR